mmetsp:Transcript_11528/g.24200  ORF Transcript_11528/g.24200 Transcript_11528/m.24200 type:complete len:111 (-) Transcript_11528:36-368(-)
MVVTVQSEMILKEIAWTAKFTRKLREEQAEQREKARASEASEAERQAEETILRFVGRLGPARVPAPPVPRSGGGGSSSGGLRSSRSSQALSAAGAMAVDGSSSRGGAGAL